MNRRLFADLIRLDLFALRQWLEQNVTTRNEAIKWAARWRTTVYGLKKFLRGEQLLSAPSLLQMSEDTGVELRKLVDYWSSEQLDKDLPKMRILTPPDRGMFVEILLTPSAAGVYQESDFTIEGITLRCVPKDPEEKSVLIPAQGSRVISTGLRVHDRKRYVLRATGGKTGTYTTDKKRTIHLNQSSATMQVVIYNRRMESQTIKRGSKIAALEIGQKAELGIVSYQIPESHTWFANRGMLGW